MSKKRTKTKLGSILIIASILIFLATILMAINIRLASTNYQHHLDAQSSSETSLNGMDMAGAVISKIGPSLSLDLGIYFSIYVTIPVSIAFIIFGILLSKSSKHLKTYTIATSIISIAALIIYFYLNYDGNFLRFLNYALTTPSLENLSSALSIILIPLTLLATSVYSIATFVRTKPA